MRLRYSMVTGALHPFFEVLQSKYIAKHLQKAVSKILFSRLYCCHSAKDMVEIFIFR